MFEVIAFDGDDTLWHSESLFAVTQERLTDLLADHVDAEVLLERLLETERRNLDVFGYGVKGFTLSMIETAIEVTDGRVSATDLHTIVGWGKQMLGHPVELLDGAADVLEGLTGAYRLALITKGDLFHQESKLAASGLGELFARIDIVSEKDPATYRRVLAGLDVSPGAFLMVGNSVRSDVLPVLEVGGSAVHIPYHVTWSLEEAAAPEDHDGYWQLDDIRQLPELVAPTGG